MIIGLCGYAGCGKTTISDRLIMKGFRRRKFAAPLKNMLRSFLRDQGVTDGVIDRMIEGDMKETPSHYLNGKSPRYAMQTLGTDWGRALICEDLWCDAATRDLESYDNVVFDDVRFFNEADAIRKSGGKIIRINRTGVGPVNDHASEAPPWADADVTNDGSVSDVTDLILQIFKTIP